ncbi:MAG: FecR domain-containing protein [Dehalococcoidia bacterium]|nr:FecR domain-containing protein [Dehalococcoidia bacterium]
MGMSEAEERTREEALDANVRALILAAAQSLEGNPLFKESLRRELEQAVSGVAGAGTVDDDQTVMSTNVGRLVSSATVDDGPGSAARQSIRNAIWRELDSRGSRTGRMRWFPRVLVLGASAVAVAGFFLYPLIWAHTRDGAELTVTQSEAEVSRVRPLFFGLGTRVSNIILTQGETMTVGAGDTISTGAASSATLSFFDRGTVTLYPTSVLTITGVEESGPRVNPSASVHLGAGQVRNLFEDFSFALLTPDVSTTVLGTAYKVDVLAGGHTKITTDEGAVRVDMEGQSVEVGAGEEVVAVRGEALQVLPQRPPRLTIESPLSPEVSSPTVVLEGTTSVDASVTVDGRTVTVGVDGSFKAEVALQPGANRVAVVATSPIGRSVTVELVLLCDC